jgi:hypothetical protein
VIRLARFGTGLLLAAALTAAAAGCGKSIASTPPASQPSISTSPSPATDPIDTSGAPIPPTTASPAQVGPALNQVEGDLNQASNASNQADSDYQAGLSAQSQGDSP